MSARLAIGLTAHDDGGPVTLSVYWSSEGLVPIARSGPVGKLVMKGDLLSAVSELVHLFMVPPLDPENAAKCAHELFEAVTDPF